VVLWPFCPACGFSIKYIHLFYRTATTSKKWKKVKTDMIRSIGKQSEEFVESVLKKKRKATVGRIVCI